MPLNCSSLVCPSSALDQLKYCFTNEPLRVTLPASTTTVPKPTEKPQSVALGPQVQQTNQSTTEHASTQPQEVHAAMYHILRTSSFCAGLDNVVSLTGSHPISYQACEEILYQT